MDGTIHVLHVDDEPDTADLVATFLEREDERMTIHSATSAEDGMAALSELEVDCIVSDYDMPGTNGIEFLEAVREQDPDLPFILYTGKGSEEIASDAISAGVTDYLQKESGTSHYTILANRIRNAVEKYAAQEKLVDRETRLNLFFEQSPLGVVRWDEEFNFARVNDTARTILGYDEGELIGQPWEVVIREDDREEIGDVVVSDLLENEGGFHSINKNVRKDGEVIVCEWHNWVVTDDNDKVVTVFSQFQDITERQERERELAELEQFNRELVENAPVGLFRLDEEMRITYENQRAEAIVGVPEAAEESPAIGKDLRDLPSVQQSDAVDALDRLAAGETVSFDTRFESILGKESYLTGRGVPLFDDGTVAGAIIMVVDITERKQREQELNEQTRQLQVVLESVESAIWIRDMESRFKLVNRKFRTLFDIDEDVDVEGCRPAELLPEHVAAQIRDNDRRVIEAGERIEFVEEVTIDDETKTYQTSIAPIVDDGEMYATCGIATDITEVKRNQRELERINEQLDGVVSIVSHELRNPLSIATGQLELAQEACESEHLDEAERALDRMDDLIDDLLTLAREGKRVDTMEAVELPAVVETCWEVMATEEATLVVDTAQTIQADERRLQQLLENLMRNAIEHGGEDVTVTVDEVADGFVLEDDGPGIAPDDREDVFEAGYTTSSTGTGFGLHIVEEIVDAHGWEITVTEGDAGGARFEISGVDAE